VFRIASLVVCLLLPVAAYAQAPAEPFRITDNSFLVEEAFNQEHGIFQNIFGATRVNGNWAGSFTQEWPLGGQTHQLSYTVSYLEGARHNGAGDTLINYRYQATMEGPGRPAFSPRLSLVIPTGKSHDGLGNGSAGLQVNLPFSKQTGDWYWHWNAGLTWLPQARTADDARRENLSSPFLAGSAIYRVRPMFNLMLESVFTYDEVITPAGTTHEDGFILSPGFRIGWDVGEKQLVAGLAVPTTWRDGDTATGLLLYFSYELPFLKQ
jgi:hypothetical protein